MSEVLNIFLMRHGKPKLPHGGRLYYGRTDYPLTEEGESCAAEMAGYLKDIKFSRVFSSDLSRARRTAELAVPAYKDKIEIVPELREINLGDWEGKSFDEVRSDWVDLFEKRGASFAAVAPPNGECFIDVQKRAGEAFDKILSENASGNILIVAHGGVIWTLMCRHFDFELNDMFFYAMGFCGIHILRRTDKMLRLVRYNWAPLPTDADF
ncbi:MAG: histidine phosphatase family protein [Synergistaceae bacterium]|nr:histidine phosphatase family protein [Synergistaceae bacterium]